MIVIRKEESKPHLGYADLGVCVFAHPACSRQTGSGTATCIAQRRISLGSAGELGSGEERVRAGPKVENAPLTQDSPFCKVQGTSKENRGLSRGYRVYVGVADAAPDVGSPAVAFQGRARVTNCHVPRDKAVEAFHADPTIF